MILIQNIQYSIVYKFFLKIQISVSIKNTKIFFI